jgi:hypothetical protein
MRRTGDLRGSPWIAEEQVTPAHQATFANGLAREPEQPRDRLFVYLLVVAKHVIKRYN